MFQLKNDREVKNVAIYTNHIADLYLQILCTYRNQKHFLCNGTFQIHLIPYWRNIRLIIISINALLGSMFRFLTLGPICAI